MQIKNTTHRYGVPARALHWIMAFLILGMLALGLYFVQQPMGHFREQLCDWHKSFGTLILILVIARIAWRLINIIPRPPANTPYWQKLAARGLHWAFYFFMFAMPLSGWLMSSAYGFPVSCFGLFTLPNLIAANKQLAPMFLELHKWMAFLLIATFCLHVGAVLKYHFIKLWKKRTAK